MAKCSLDIKLDIVDEVRETLDRDGFSATSRQTLDITDSEKAREAIERVNARFGEKVVTFSYTSANTVYIDPSDSLVNEYYKDYINKMGFKQLNEEERRRGGYTEEDRGTFFQTVKGEVFTQSLKEKLLSFLKGLNIHVEMNADDLLNSSEFKNKPLAAFDVLQKFMAFASGQEKLLPQQVAYAAYTFLGRKSNLSKSLWKFITKWENYDKVYNQYKNEDWDIEDMGLTGEEDYMEDEKFNPFAHRMAIIKFLEESLLKAVSGQTPTSKELSQDIDADYFKSKGRLNPYEGSELQKIFNKIFNKFKDLLGNPVFKKYNRQDLTNLGLDIAEDILKGDFSKFIRGITERDGKLHDAKGNELELKDYEKTLNKDSFAVSIIKKLTDNPYINFKLSGSLTIRKYGKVFRKLLEDLHDIDGVITLDTFNQDPRAFEFRRWLQTEGLALMRSGKNKKFFLKAKKRIEELNWYQNLKQEFPEFVMTNAFIGRDHRKGESITISGYVEHPTEKEIDSETKLERPKRYVLDFFLRTDEGNYPEIFDNYWKDWKQIFEAKLNMGRSKDIADLIYFSPYIKDKFKFTNKGFRFFSFETAKEDQQLSQLSGMAMSKASQETLERVKEAAKKMGISIQDLADYAKSNPEIDTKSVNGVADLVRGVIAVATGRENAALTEEMVHIATAILEQTNPQMVTAMISKIDRFKIYKTTFEKYKNNKAYQLANGKPNVRKIKKEAADKLIAELIVLDSEGSTNFPELFEEQPKSMIKGWWQAILDFIRRKYSSSNIDIFREAAKVVISGEVGGTVADIKDAGVFYQVVEKNEAVDRIYDKFIDIDKRMQLVPGVGDEKRHYTLDGKKIAMSVTEKVKAESSKNMPERTDMEKRQDEQKRDWGSEGHRFVEEYISAALIDENGYARPKALDVTLSTNINPLVQKKLMDFAKELIASYPAGTKFLLEKKVVNQNVKGMLASTIDFIAIQPITKEDGTKDVKVDILDWKFTNVNKERDDDVPWPKQLEWKAQMGEYSKMAYSTYGIQRNQLRKTRMIPFQSNYVYNIPGDAKSGLHLQSIEIGKLDSTTETNLYLLPVPLNNESTGNEKIDRLLASLRQQYEKIYTAPPDPEKKFLKDITLKQLERAIRKLHLQLDFEPLAAVGETFVNNAEESLKEFENLDFTKLSKDELVEKLKTLLEYQKSAEKFFRIDEIFLAVNSEESLFDEEKRTLNSLRNTTFATRSFLERIDVIQKAFTVQISLKEGITTEATKESVLKAEREADWLSKTFLEASKLPQKIIKLSANLIMNARSAQNIEANKVINEFGKLLTPLEQQAAAQGKSAFDLIGTSTGGKLSLIKKLKKEFWEQIDLAKKSRDLEFLKKNMDVEKYNEMVKEVIAKKEEILNRTVFSTDPEENQKQLDYRIKKLKDSLDINRKTFNGYEGYDFAIYFNKAINEEIEENLSPEYVKLRNNPTAFAMWKFMVGLNEKARDMGYLKKKGMSFFPLMEASIIDKIGQTSDAVGQVKDFFNDIYTARINERPGFAKTDPETGRLKKQIPKLFTQTDRDVSMLSRDLNKVGVLWINALFQYQTSKQLENTLLTLHQVEKNKGHIIVDENGDIVFESGDPKIDERSNKNADILETIIDDAVYGIKDDLSSLGNKLISGGTGVVKKDAEAKEEAAVSVKKSLNNANKLVQALAVGLKPLIAVANYFGVNFQTFINAGRFYNYGEYTKNNLKVTTGTGLTTIDKGLIDLIFPLNEDLTKEKRRQLAKENSYIKYLSTWTFSDVMMITNSWGERKLQLANALSFNENSMVVDGKIVNIRQYLQKQDSQAKKTMTEIERRDLERTFEDRVSKLKESSSLNKVAVIENDQVVIPGVSVEELAKYRTKVIEFGRNLNGQMSQDNRAAYRRDTILSSFMMFKNWIPKLLGARILDIQKNIELDEWEYGRVRLFIKTMMGVANYNLLDIREIISGSDKGLRLMDQMLEAKKAEYFAKTGQQLEITPEEFYDMVRKELSNLAKEAGLVFGMLGILIAAKVAAPDNDEDELTRNRYKWYLKAINKITDELIFYYNPMSFESITTGSVFPAFNLTVQAEKFARNLVKEGYGELTGDEELIEKAHPTKYFLNMIPGAAQFQNEVLPYINPELAKEMGIRVTAESRRR
jgi:hypothetical protein